MIQDSRAYRVALVRDTVRLAQSWQDPEDSKPAISQNAGRRWAALRQWTMVMVLSSPSELSSPTLTHSASTHLTVDIYLVDVHAIQKKYPLASAQASSAISPSDS